MSETFLNLISPPHARFAWFRLFFSHWTWGVTLLTLACANSFAGVTLVIDDGFHHLRNAQPREWSHFPEKPLGGGFRASFDVPGSRTTFSSLTLRQSDVKQKWSVILNGTIIGTLDRDHNDLHKSFPLNGALLKPTGNLLEIACESATPDDIRVGEVSLTSTGPLTYGSSVVLSAVDADGAPIPCRFTIVHADNGSLALLSNRSDNQHAVRSGVIYCLDGKVRADLYPGKYRVYAGRGFEYSLESAELNLAPGQSSVLPTFTLEHQVPTDGLVSCDPHLHTLEFAGHGDATLVERLVSLAGEGVELAISTEHNKHIDYTKEAKRIGAAKWFTSVLGCEVTTSQGHFNSFPVEPGAPVAEHKLRPWEQIFANIYQTPGVKVCILNHARDIHGGFTPLGEEVFDPLTGTFRQGRKMEANAIELINSGAQQTDPMQLIYDWFAMLNAGHKMAGIGASDSHSINFVIPGQARTYIPVDDSDVSKIDVAAATDAVVAGKTEVSFGLLCHLNYNETEKALKASVLGPDWSTASHLLLYADGVDVGLIDIPKELQKKAGQKFEFTWKLDDEKNAALLDAKFICAVAVGPGTTEGWWPCMPPYQAQSPDFDPYMMGISSIVWMPEKEEADDEEAPDSKPESPDDAQSDPGNDVEDQNQ